MNKTKTINKTKTMTTLHFSDGYRTTEFLGLDDRPEDHDRRTESAIASPAQIAKIKRAIADGVRVEVVFIKANGPRPNTVRVHTYGTHRAELSQNIRQSVESFSRECLAALDEADRLADPNAEPLAPRFHKERAEQRNKWLNYDSRRLLGLVGQYVDPAFLKYPRRGRKSPSTP